ncbi:MAG: ATP-binding protein [Acidobacteriota bacterium]
MTAQGEERDRPERDRLDRDSPDRDRPAEEGRLSVHLTVQHSRGVAFVGMYIVGMVGQRIGILQFDERWAHALAVVAVASALLFHRLYSLRLDRPWGLELHYVWMACDVVFLTWMVGLTHESSSLWLVWYLTNSAAAAFVAGRRALVWVTLANCAAYLALLVALGEIGGFDRGLATALLHLALLYSASFFFLRGIADLRDKRLRIRELAKEKSRQLEELRRLTETLDRQARELADAHLRSQEASRAKSQFLANMSHELRTPLNSIIGFSEILREKLAETAEPRYLKFLGNILEAGRHLLGLINDILDLSKIEAGKMELSLEKVALADLAQGVRSVMLGVVGRRGIELTTDFPADLPALVVDEPKVKQILYNLVSNAIKFSPDGSQVRLGARRAEPGDADEGSVEIWVSDDGIGIPPEEQAAIFEEFRQVDGDSNRAHGGTGLGLALVRRFAEMHGGRVDVESAPGEGSTFRVRLPIDASSAETTEASTYSATLPER